MKKVKVAKSSKKKRKAEPKSEISINKKQKVDNDDENSSDNKDIKEPTAEEIIESEKPENIYSVKSIRSKQKEKHTKNVEQKQSKSKLQIKNHLESYLRTWNDDRPNWKYKKLIQVEIISNLFNEDILSSNIWPIVIEYLSGSQGKAKENIVEKSEKEIAKLDDLIQSGNKDLLKGVIYSRARDLLQRLN